jgi:hypothetical protein
VTLVLGIRVLLLAGGLLTGGATLPMADQARRDADGVRDDTDGDHSHWDVRGHLPRHPAAERRWHRLGTDDRCSARSG